MKALILNSGLGSRMGEYTNVIPKGMVKINSLKNDDTETILSRQIRLLENVGIEDIVITTGFQAQILMDYVQTLKYSGNIRFVNNPIYKDTNYIFSICLAREYLDDDILLLHGDMVFDEVVLHKLLQNESSCMCVNYSQILPEKDFKAVLGEDEKIDKIGIDFFENAVAAYPLYKINKKDWRVWLQKIVEFCESENTKCYAENAFNSISNQCEISPFGIDNYLCMEVDTPEDLRLANQRIADLKNRKVYMCFSTDVIHGGHLKIIDRAAQLGTLTAGILSDEAVCSYKRYPLLKCNERKDMILSIKGVHDVVEQEELSYIEIIKKYKPDIVVHGEDWKSGFQAIIRQEVIEVLESYGGTLVEYAYSSTREYEMMESNLRSHLSIPDMRRKRLRDLIDMKGLINAIEAHSGITGLIAEKTAVYQEGKTYQFDAMWVSSLCDSTAKGKPDIELVDMTSRFRTIDDIMEVTTKPIIFDGDTGGLLEHFVYTVKSLERMGVSAVIIEDKTGLKKNSLFGTEVVQTQDSIDNFCAKISAGKRAQKTQEFMIIARVESLILEQGMDDALERAFAYVGAGADGIMIHSRKKDPDEIFEFVSKFREKNKITPIVVVPTSFNTVTEQEFKDRGVNVVIYANQLTRSAFPAMKSVAESILKNHRSAECDSALMSIKEIISLIPEEM